RFDPLLLGLAVELDRAGHGAVVREPDRRHLELSSAGRKGRDPAGPVEDRVLGVDVKVDERRFWHGTPILDLAQDRTTRPRTPACRGGGRPFRGRSVRQRSYVR